MELDLIDKRIIAQLDRNCRASNSEVARALKLNKSVVGYRIKNLENEGVLLGYCAIINTFRLGYMSYRAYLKLQYAGPEKQQEMMDYLVTQPCVWWVGHIHGNYNVVILMWAKKQSDIVQFWENFNSKFRNNVADARISFYHGLEQFGLPFEKEALGKKAEPVVIGAIDDVEIDATDAKLLKTIAANARMPLLDISAALGITPATVRYRLRQLLKKGVIVGFRANVGLEKLGYTLYKTDFNLRDMAAQEKILLYARQQPCVAYIDHSIGWADCEIELCTREPGEFYSELEKIRSRFSSSIRDFGFFEYSKITKLLYVPADL